MQAIDDVASYFRDRYSQVLEKGLETDFGSEKVTQLNNPSGQLSFDDASKELRSLAEGLETAVGRAHASAVASEISQHTTQETPQPISQQEVCER